MGAIVVVLTTSSSPLTSVTSSWLEVRGGKVEVSTISANESIKDGKLVAWLVNSDQSDRSIGGVYISCTPLVKS